MAAVLKTASRGDLARGFESHALRIVMCLRTMLRAVAAVAYRLSGVVGGDIHRERHPMTLQGSGREGEGGERLGCGGVAGQGQDLGSGPVG